ncbi:hypothetical protein [Algoriphagus namhaensis]
MKNILLFALVYSILFFSCKKKENKESSKVRIKNNYSISLERIDSITFDYIGNPTIHDLDPKNRMAIFMEHKESSQIINITSFDGQLISSLSKWGDQPDNYGKLLASLKIINKNSFYALGTRGLLKFNFDGTLISSVHISEIPLLGFSNIGMGDGMEELNSGFTIENRESTPKLKSGKEYYSNIKPLLLVLPNKNEIVGILKIPDSSIFLKGKWFFNNAWDPAYTVIKDQIVIAFGLEPKLYCFSSNELYSLIKEFPLNLPDYQYFKGLDEFSSDVRFFGQARTSGKILNVKKFNDFFIISYFPGFNASDMEESFINKSPEASIEFWSKMKEKYPSRIAILDSTGNVINDFVPEGLEPSSMLLRDGQLWMMEKPDEEVERDYYRLFRVGLKVENI